MATRDWSKVDWTNNEDNNLMRLQKIGVSTITLLKDEMFFRMVMKFGPTLHWNLGYQCYG